MPRSALPAVALFLLILLGSLAWWLANPSQTTPTAATPAEVEQAPLELPAPPPLLAVAESPSEPLDTRRSEVREPEAAATAWMRGRLNVVRGEARTALTVVVSAHWTPGGNPSSRPLRLVPPEFAFEIPAHGLAPTCLISLPEFVRAVAVVPGELAERGRVRLHSVAEPARVDVEIDPYFAVLFLHDPSGEPLAGAVAKYALQHRNGRNTSEVHLDANGMLFLPYSTLDRWEEWTTLTFSVLASRDIGESVAAPILRTDLPKLPQPHVLRFAATQRLTFQVEDPEHRPIPTAILRIGVKPAERPINWQMLNPADSESPEPGVYTVAQSLPPADSVHAEARGFVPAEQSITAAALAAGQQLVLVPASWIELAVQAMPPEGPESLEFEIRFDGEADGSLLSPDRFIGGRLVRHGGFSGSGGDPSRKQRHHRGTLDAGGMALLDGVHVDVPATVTVSHQGARFFEVRVPLQPGDGRHFVRIPPLPEAVPLFGRVVDELGRPLESVVVFMQKHKTRQTLTDGDGRFELGSAPDGSHARLVFRRPGRGMRVIESRLDGAAPDSVGTIVMPPEQVLVVSVLDPEGAPFVRRPGTKGERFQVQVAVDGEVLPAATDPQGRVEPGEWHFAELPAGEVSIILGSSWAWKHRLEQRVDTTAGRVSIRLTPEAAAALQESI